MSMKTGDDKKVDDEQSILDSERQGSLQSQYEN